MPDISETSVRRILHEHWVLSMNKISAFNVNFGSNVRISFSICVVKPQSRFCGSMPLGMKQWFCNMILQWKGTLPKKRKVVQSTKEVVKTIFWDCESFSILILKIAIQLLITYYESFLYKLRKNYRKKYWGKLTKSVRLLHDNALIYTASISISQPTIQECGFEAL